MERRSNDAQKASHPDPAGARRRVVLVTPSLCYGGAEQQVVLLALMLARLGFEVRVHCLHDRGPFAATLETAGIMVSGGQTLLTWPWRAFRAVKRAVLRRRPGNGAIAKPVAPTSGRTLWQLGNEMANEALYDLTAIGTWLQCLWYRPQVVHAFQSYTKASLIAARVAGCPATVYSEVCQIGDFFSPLQLRALNRCLAHTHSVIAMSDAIRTHLLQIGVRAEAITVIPTMLDPGEPRPPASVTAAPPKHLRLGTVSRLVEGKGHGVLLAAMAELDKTDSSATLLVGGDGPLRQEIADDVARRGLASRVELRGSFVDLEALLAEFEVFVLASFSEGMPVSVLEAMFAGKAVIASRVGGITTQVEHGVTGLLVEPGDPVALAAAIKKLSQDPVLVASMGRAGQQRAREQFDAAVVTRRIVKLYEPGLTGAGSEIRSSPV